nr:fibrinolytic metalloproteinase [Agkistrodon contortrix=southern copperhead, ssp. contortrix, Peptide Partial, 11 aa] [Agkistrodon contortrix]
MAHELGHNLGM